jgi:hypothetical protein
MKKFLSKLNSAIGITLCGFAVLVLLMLFAIFVIYLSIFDRQELKALFSTDIYYPEDTYL